MQHFGYEIASSWKAPPYHGSGHVRCVLPRWRFARLTKRRMYGKPERDLPAQVACGMWHVGIWPVRTPLRKYFLPSAHSYVCVKADRSSSLP